MSKLCSDLLIKKKIANLSLKWCKENLGVNKNKTMVKLFLRIKQKKNNGFIFLGNYFSDENRIFIYGLRDITIYDIVSTIIHEYTHYLQSNKKYWLYFKTHDYLNHPYEREARRNEMKYSKNCLEEISKLIN